VKSLKVTVTVFKGAGGFGGTYGGRFLVGSAITSLGGGDLRPSATADGGTFGKLVPPNSEGMIAGLPIAKMSRKKRDPIAVDIFIGGNFCRFLLQLGEAM
jgi:hypothetical protein